MVSQADIAAYLRISSLAIALFDFVSTIPGEIRLYSQQSSLKRLSPACILFVLIRYISVAALVTSNYGFFATGFSSEACHHFYLIAPVLKLLATLVSQVIISIRTYAIARKPRRVFWILLVLFVIALVPEIMGNVVHRVVSQNKEKNCTSGNIPGAKLAWLHYLAAMIFDAIAMGIASYYLFISSKGMIFYKVTCLSRMMLEEGIIYFLALTTFNVLNLVLFQSDNFAMQSAATTLGQAVTMIFSQKLILNLSDGTFEQRLLRDRDRSSSHHTFGASLLSPPRSFINPSSPPSPLSPMFHTPIQLPLTSSLYDPPVPLTIPAYQHSSIPKKKILVNKKSISSPLGSPVSTHSFEGPNTRVSIESSRSPFKPNRTRTSVVGIDVRVERNVEVIIDAPPKGKRVRPPHRKPVKMEPVFRVMNADESNLSRSVDSANDSELSISVYSQETNGISCSDKA